MEKHFFDDLNFDLLSIGDIDGYDAPVYFEAIPNVLRKQNWW